MSMMKSKITRMNECESLFMSTLENKQIKSECSAFLRFVSYLHT